MSADKILGVEDPELFGAKRQKLLKSREARAAERLDSGLITLSKRICS
jgi:hypothetical protein